MALKRPSSWALLKKLSFYCDSVFDVGQSTYVCSTHLTICRTELTVTPWRFRQERMKYPVVSVVLQAIYTLLSHLHLHMTISKNTCCAQSHDVPVNKFISSDLVVVAHYRNQYRIALQDESSVTVPAARSKKSHGTLVGYWRGTILELQNSVTILVATP